MAMMMPAISNSSSNNNNNNHTFSLSISIFCTLSLSFSLHLLSLSLLLCFSFLTTMDDSLFSHISCNYYNGNPWKLRESAAKKESWRTSVGAGLCWDAALEVPANPLFLKTLPTLSLVLVLFMTQVFIYINKHTHTHTHTHTHKYKHMCVCVCVLLYFWNSILVLSANFESTRLIKVISVNAPSVPSYGSPLFFYFLSVFLSLPLKFLIFLR